MTSFEFSELEDGILDHYDSHTTIALLPTEIIGLIVSMIDLWDVARLFCIGNHLLSSTLVTLPQRRKMEFTHPHRLGTERFPPIAVRLARVKTIRFEIDPTSPVLCHSTTPLAYASSKTKELALCFRNCVDWWMAGLVPSSTTPVTPRGTPNLVSRFVNLRTLRLNSSLAMSRSIVGKVFSTVPRNLTSLYLGSIGDSSVHTFAKLPSTLQELSLSSEMFHMASLERLKSLRKFSIHVSVLTFDPAMKLPKTLNTFSVQGLIEVRRAGATLGNDIGPLLELLPSSVTSLEGPAPVLDPWVTTKWWKRLKHWTRNSRQQMTGKSSSIVPPSLASLTCLHGMTPAYLDRLLENIPQSTLVTLVLKRTVTTSAMIRLLPPTLTKLWVGWSPNEHGAVCKVLPPSITHLIQGHSTPEALWCSSLSALPPSLRYFQHSYQEEPTLMHVNLRELGPHAPTTGLYGTIWTSAHQAASQDLPSLLHTLISLQCGAHAHIESLDILYVAVKAGSMRVLKFFEKQRLVPHFRQLSTQSKLPEGTFADLAVEHAPSKALRWLHSNKFEFILSARVMHSLIQKSAISTLKWLHKTQLLPQDAPVCAGLTSTAIRQRNLRMLRWMLKKGVARFDTPWILTEAKKEGTDQSLTFLKSVAGSFPPMDLYEAIHTLESWHYSQTAKV